MADVALDRPEEAPEVTLAMEEEADTAAHSADWRAWAAWTSAEVQLLWRQESADCWKAVEPQTQLRSVKLEQPLEDAALWTQPRMQGSMPAVLVGTAAEAVLLLCATALPMAKTRRRLTERKYIA